MEENLSFIPLLLVVILAFLVPMVLAHFKHLRLPIVVGEIVAGMIIGRSGLGLVAQEDPILELLAEFGFVFLMFLSGLEIDFSNLGFGSRRRAKLPEEGWSPLTIGLVSFGLTLVLSTLLGFGLLEMGLIRNPLMMALILSTTSLGIVVPVLKEHGLSTGRYGQTLLISSLIADFATMLLITVEVAALSRGLTLDILLIGLLFVAFFLVYQFGMHLFNRITTVRRMMQDLVSATAQIKMRAAFAMMLIFVGLSEFLGTEIILGAFLAGAIISLLRRPEDTESVHHLEAIGYGFFIPIFFIMVGVNFDMRALLSSPSALLLVPLLLIAAVSVKTLPALVFRKGFGWRETVAAGFLLSSRLSLIIAASAIGMRLGVISDSVNAAIILVAIISVTTAPLLFIRIIPQQTPEHLRPIIIAGAGELGVQTANQLIAHHEPVVVIDRDAERVRRARQHGLTVLLDDGCENEAEIRESFNLAKSLVCTYNDTDANYHTCHQARTVYGIDHVVAHVTKPSDLPRFRQLGVTTMNAALDRASLLTMLTRNPALYDLLVRTEDDKEVAEVEVHNPVCFGKPLRQLGLPGDVLVLALRRNGELLVPHGNTLVEAQDHLTLAGSTENIAQACDMFGICD